MTSRIFMIGILIIFIGFLSGAGAVISEKTAIEPASLLFSSNFNQNAEGWTTSTNSYAAGGQYHIVGQENDGWQSYRALASERCVVTVDATALSDRSGGFGFGVVIRRQKDNSSGYAFFINSNRSYAVFRLDGREKYTILKPWTRSDALHDNLKPETSGLRNRIEVRAWDEIMDFHINGRAVARVSDAKYRSGDVALHVNRLQHVAFDNFRYREARLLAGEAVPVTAASAPPPKPTAPASSEPRRNGASLSESQKHFLKELGMPEVFSVVFKGSERIETWLYHRHHVSLSFRNGVFQEERFELVPLESSAVKFSPPLGPGDVTSGMTAKTLTRLLGESPAVRHTRLLGSKKVEFLVYDKGVTASFDSKGNLLTLLARSAAKGGMK